MATSPLQKSPIGLLQAFNLQTLGQAPIGFSDVVVPTQRAEPWYLRDLVGVGNLGGTVATTFTSATDAEAVPASELWYVYGGYARHTPPTGDVAMQSILRTDFFISNGDAVVVDAHYFNPASNWISTSVRYSSWWLPEPFLLRGGDELRVTLELSGAATADHTYGAAVIFARIR